MYQQILQTLRERRTFPSVSYLVLEHLFFEIGIQDIILIMEM